MSIVTARVGAGLLIISLLVVLTPFSLTAFPTGGGGLDEAILEGPTCIMIDGNLDLASQATAYSWPGDGTSSNPYTISDMTLVCNDTCAAICVLNTTLSITFHNITVQDGRVGNYDPLIILENVTGLRLKGVMAYASPDESVTIARSSEVVIEDCTFGTLIATDCSRFFIGNSTIHLTNGLRAERCLEFSFLANTIDHVGYFQIIGCDGFTLAQTTFNYVITGVSLSDSVNTTFWSNAFLDCSIGALRDGYGVWEAEFLRTMTATSNNTINGLPLMFLRDIDLGGGSIPAGAGQVLLMNVSNAVLSGHSINSVSNGLTAVSCHNITVSSNSITWAMHGIMVDDSDAVTLRGNTLNHCFDGIMAKRCGDLSISENWLNGSYRDIMVNMPGAGHYAIHLSDQDNGEVVDNIVGSYWWGPMADTSSGIEFARNSVTHAFYGLIATSSHDVRMMSNTISNADYGIVLSVVQTSVISGNSIAGGDVGCYLNDGDNNRIISNRIIGCYDYGINVRATSSGNVILGNILRSNNGAGAVYSSSAVQAYDKGSGNAWSNSWSGGNKWGDWSSPDANNDSYVDSPYVIDGNVNAKDYFPYASHTTVIDDMSPTLTITTPVNGSWQSSTRVYFAWQANDPQTSIFRYFGNLGNSGWFDLGGRTTFNRTLGEGRQEMAIMAVDLAGNRVIQQTVVYIDTRPPVLTIGSVGQFISSADLWVNWTVTDQGIGLDRVELSLDGGEWINVTGSSSYLLTDLSGPNVHNIRLKATDRLGLERMAQINTTVDLTYDHLEILAPTGELTNAEVVTVEWEAYDLLAGTSKVELSVDGQDWFVVTGTDHSLTGLGDGEHTIRLRAWDHAGNNATRSTTVIIDRTAPTLRIISPLPGVVLGTSEVEVEWESSGAHDLTCQWRLDDGQWSSVTGNFTVHGLVDGTHTIELSCRDEAGNYANESVAITIDTEPPLVSITSPLSGQHLGIGNVTVSWEVEDVSDVGMSWRIDSGDGNNITSFNVTLSGLSDGPHLFELSCRDGVGLYTNTTVEFTVDTTAPTVVVVSPGEGWYSDRSIEVRWEGEDLQGIDRFRLLVDSSWTDLSGSTFSMQLNGLTDGPHTIMVMAVDKAGNSNSTEITIWIDATAPLLDITAPLDGSFGSSPSLTVAWTTSDLSGIGSLWLRFDDGPWINVSSSTSYVNDALFEGVHTISFNITDVLGNFAASSVTYTVDLTAPTIEIISPAEGTFLGPSVYIGWEANDDRGIDRFSVRVDNGPWQNVQASLRSTVVGGLSGGGHLVDVRVIDLAGNVVSDNVTFTVDATPPIVRITSPAGPAYNNTGAIEVTWISYDNGTGISHHSVSCDGSDWTDVNGTSYTFDLPDGTYVISVRAYDLVGNSADASLTLVVDTIGPNITITAPLDGSYRNSSDMNATWTANDATSGIAYYEISVDGAPGIRVNGTSFPIEGLSEGAHALSVKAYDLVGNNGESCADFIIDLTRPSLNITSPASGGIISTDNVTVTWDCSEVNGIAYFEASLDGGNPLRLGPDRSSFDLVMVSEGSHSISVLAVDMAGNSRTATVSFVMDRTAPTAECQVLGDPRSASWNVTVELSEPISMEDMVIFINGMGYDPACIGPDRLVVSMEAPMNGDELTINLTCRDLAGNFVELAWTIGMPPLMFTVNGCVMDEDGDLMAGAKVYCDGALLAEADAQGEFSFNTTPGIHNLVIIMDGHISANITIDLNSTNGSAIGVVVLTNAEDTGSEDQGTSILMAIVAIALVALVGTVIVSLARKRKR